MNAPLVLGFDTSAAHCDAALVRGGRVLAHRREDMSRGQAERLMDMLAEVLSDGGSGYAELDAIGVGTGPGNFTGIRIAVSAARGLSLGLGIPAVGVPVFDALRHGTDAPCACAIAAPRGQVYLQRFAADGSGTAPELVSADAIPAHDGPLIGACGQTPVHPTAVAVALLAAERARGAATPRPAPVYLRPADAAPARDAAPVILP